MESQKNFVATNLDSLADTFVDWRHTGVYPMAYGIYNEEDKKVFFMAFYDGQKTAG